MLFREGKFWDVINMCVSRSPYPSILHILPWVIHGRLRDVCRGILEEEWFAAQEKAEAERRIEAAAGSS